MLELDGTEEEDDSEEYEVEAILRDRVVDGRRLYLVKWLGFERSLNSTTWEPIENLYHANDLLSQYKKAKKARDEGQVKSVKEAREETQPKKTVKTFETIGPTCRESPGRHSNLPLSPLPVDQHEVIDPMEDNEEPPRFRDTSGLAAFVIYRS